MCNGNCNQGRDCSCDDRPRTPMTPGEARLLVVIYLISAATVIGVGYLIFKGVTI